MTMPRLHFKDCGNLRIQVRCCNLTLVPVKLNIDRSGLMKFNLKPYLTLVVLAVLVPLSHAQQPISVPSAINYQGALLDSAGNKLPDGNTNVVFRVFDAVFNGRLLWGPRTNSVALVGSVFNTLLGGTDAQSRDFGQILVAQALVPNAPAFLELSVGGISIQPRQQILSVPFALVANTAGTAAYATNALSAVSSASADLAQNASRLNGFTWSDLLTTGNAASGSLDGNRILDGSISGTKLAQKTIAASQLRDDSGIVVSPEPKMRIIRGSVSKDGIVRRGSGFTVKPSITQAYSLYEIVYDVPFSSPPTVIASPDEPSQNVTTVIDNSAGYREYSFLEFHTVSGSPVTIPVEFNFIAVGPY